ncbi:hypothetical protein QTH90_21380 [Variovorax sp. J2P1-59]|uniref:hypothetical protein n=1 Tax=Variovorax flavidus TaxID=3053501 RepID=UPI002574ECB0|nr:hypothetical protein [Variovorax sp. J2P1-59]MDM0076976.1 hypothetical protein [Variovorax sp. J2P1-59]
MEEVEGERMEREFMTDGRMRPEPDIPDEGLVVPSNEASIEELLRQLESLLRARGEQNWLRGVTAARAALASAEGMEDARSIYASMNRGAGSFADYNVWGEDFDERVELNQPLDRIRADLWQRFGLAR